MPVRRYLTGLGLSHVQTEDGAYHAYHQDEQGNTVYITGQGLENCYQYDAFGNLTEKKETFNNRILYTGQQYDQETGQYYLRARYYNPVAGRFLQEDTYRGDGLNLYAYCANNPVMYYDPSGHSKTNDPLCGNPEAKEPGNPLAGQVSNEGGTGSKGESNSKLSKAADEITQKAQEGNLKRSSDYHGRLDNELEKEILSYPDAVYVTNNNKQNFVYRKETDVVIVESKGSSKGNIITSYGPSGPRGESGASIFGGSPSDPGMPVTHNDIITGIKQPGGGTFPPATQIR